MINFFNGNSRKSEKLDAVVMAGGFGSRLAPMTNSRPKPLMPVYNRTCFERILDLLAQNGFKNAGVTTMYLPEQLERIKHDKINLSFFRESEPKGSAGAVRALYENLCDTVIVISGDAVCDFSLKKHLEKHKAENRKATLLLTKTKIPGEFGTVLTEKSSGRILRFLEKPSWTDTLTNLINTGIYILDKSIIKMIPEGNFFDFGKDFFPMLMRNKVPLHGEEAEGYWCDIGSTSDFYDCSMLFSNGKSIFGCNNTVSNPEKIKESILFDNVCVGDSEVIKSIVCENAYIGNGCLIPEGCVIGAGCIIGDNAVLSPGIKISDKIKIGRGARIMNNVFFNSSVRHLFGDEGICGAYGSEIDGELCFKLGQALFCLGKPAKIGVMSDASETGVLLADIIKVGVKSSGAKLLDLEKGFLEIASFAPSEYDLDCAIFVLFKNEKNSTGNVYISMFEKNGLSLSRDKQRKTESAMREKTATPKEIIPSEALLGDKRIKNRYCRFLQIKTGSLENIKISCSGKGDALNFFFSNARELNATISAVFDSTASTGDLFVFEENGFLHAETEKGKKLDFWQLFILACQGADEKELYLPQSTPESVEKYLNAIGFKTFFYNDNDSSERKNAFSTHFYTDRVFLALMVCRFMKHNSFSLDKAAETLPPFFLRSIDIDFEEEDKADKIGILAAECEDCSRGVRLHTEKGSVAFFPRVNGGFRIYAESVNAEFADELCDFAQKKIKNKNEQ